MSLIIGLVLLVILLVRVGDDKLKQAEYKREKRERDQRLEDFKSRYVAEELEKQLKECIDDERNHAAIMQEIRPALVRIEHLEDLLAPYCISRKFSLKSSKCKEIAYNIMLANRGKIDSWVYMQGYKGPLISKNSLKERIGFFEYVDVILNIMRRRYPEMEIYVHIAEYIWKGSFADGVRISPEYVKKFDKKIIFPEDPTPIPPIE